jgi:hypothetical protein
MSEQHPLTVGVAPDRECTTLHPDETMVAPRLSHAHNPAKLVNLEPEFPRFPGEINQNREDEE